MQDTDHDYHNFSTPSSHRLPTISGTQAIRNAIFNSKPITTGLASLDSVLSPTGVGLPGLRRGTVTEVFGPPGVGKTTFALQAAMNAICHENDKVVWIDTCSPLQPQRLVQLLEGVQNSNTDSKDPSSQPPTHDELDEYFTHLEITSLPKLLAMFLHPLTGFPGSETSLVVLDDLSTLLLSSLPRKSRSTTTMSQITPSQVRADHAVRQATSRRTQTISSLASALQTFAATHNVALLVTCKAKVSLKTGQQAFLQSALSSQQWDACLGSRIVLYRDFWPSDVPESTEDGKQHEPTNFERRSLRYAQVLEIAGREVSTTSIGFVIEQNRLHEVISLRTSDRQSILSSGMQVLPGSDDIDEGLREDDDGVEFIPNETSLDLAIRTEESGRTQATKRKAIEIADSDDEDGIPELSSDVPDAAIDENRHGPQSQDGQTFPRFQSAKKVRSETDFVDTSEKMVARVEAEDEMLLDQIEARAQIPAFSQAAAEMSDPLTPSDDGHRSP